MRTSVVIQKLKSMGLVGLAISLTAFSTPEKGQLVELKGFLKARAEAKFRSADNNTVYVLQPGTRALIAESKYFPDSKNYGLCLDIKNASDLEPGSNCVWVYYDVKNPALKIYSESKNASNREKMLEAWAQDSSKVTLKPVSEPSQAKAAEVTRKTAGVVEKRPESKGLDTETPLKMGLESLDQVNRKVGQAMSSNGQACENCSKPNLQGYESCSSKNDYLENALESILNQSAHSAFFQNPQKEIISTSCIQKNMSMFTKSSSFFRNCSGKGSHAVQKACISENYVQVTSRSFNLAADCLGDYVSGQENTKSQVALSVFSLMSLESGMNVNAMSNTGPGGPGQMSGGAIEAVNQELRSIREHLSRSRNNHCSQTLAKVLENPMSSSKSCDRISPNQDNPLKSMAYAFAYQGLSRRAIEKQAFSSRIFANILSEQLPVEEKERLMMEISAWSHNTGPAGILNPIRALLIKYMRTHQKIETAEDVTQFFKDLRPFLATHGHASNRGRERVTETMNYYSQIQNRMKLIAEDPRSCLTR